MKRLVSAIATIALTVCAGAAFAAPATYKIDPTHTFITFKTSHIGFAWIPGSFNEFEGQFKYDAEDRANSSAQFTVQTDSIDTHYATRDKHLRERDGLMEVAEFPTAKFVSTDYEPTGENTGKLKGDLTIKGETRPVTFDVKELAGREDPWGNFRRAFQATTEVSLTDFGITYFADNGMSMPETATIKVAIEGLRQ
ncbi:MAG: YceI family protein [Ectothiorhodospiraceae bacterium]|jgi:polyisoprenoid-binding protein YceI